MKSYTLTLFTLTVAANAMSAAQSPAGTPPDAAWLLTSNGGGTASTTPTNLALPNTGGNAYPTNGGAALVSAVQFLVRCRIKRTSSGNIYRNLTYFHSSVSLSLSLSVCVCVFILIPCSSLISHSFLRSAPLPTA